MKKNNSHRNLIPTCGKEQKVLKYGIRNSEDEQKRKKRLEK